MRSSYDSSPGFCTQGGIRVFYALHRRYRPGDYETWKYIAPIQKAAWSRKTFEYGTWGSEIRREFVHHVRGPYLHQCRCSALREATLVTYLTTYTFGKTVSDSPGFGGGGQGQAGRIQNILNKKLEKGLAGLDHRHRFTTAAGYEPPFGRGRKFGSSWGGPLNAIGGGWALDGDCFVAPESLIPGDMRYGTAGRGTVQGPGIINTDFSVRKETNITEKIRTEFRAEFFNLFNHANWSAPARDLGNSNLGRITNTADPRIVQFALKLYF